MNFNVAQLLKEPIGASRDFTVEERLTDVDRPAEYVSGSGRMIRTHHGIWARGGFNAQIAQDCSRCLTTFGRTLDFDLDEEYFPEIDVRSGHRILPPDDWEGLFITDNHNLNLTEALRQCILTELPLKPLCRPECGGICDRCGADLNTSQCDCAAGDIDPRWAALRALITDLPT